MRPSEGRTSSRIALAFVTTALLLLAVGCKSEDNTVQAPQGEDRVIAAVVSTDDPSQFVVSWFPAPCEAFDEVQVELDDTYANLKVRVIVDVDACPNSSPGEVVVSLGEPLGDRLVWDRAFNDTVAVDAE